MFMQGSNKFCQWGSWQCFVLDINISWSAVRATLEKKLDPMGGGGGGGGGGGDLRTVLQDVGFYQSLNCLRRLKEHGA